MCIKTIDYKLRIKRGPLARLVVVFFVIMIVFLIMLLFGCLHSKRLKKPIKKQAYISTSRTGMTVVATKPLPQKSIHLDVLGTATKKRRSGIKKLEKDALRSRQMRVVRAKRLNGVREKREELAYIFQDVYPPKKMEV